MSSNDRQAYLTELFDQVTSGLTEEEKTGFFLGLQSGLSEVSELVKLLEKEIPDITSRLINGFGFGLKQPDMISIIKSKREEGNSAEFLREQVHISIVEAITGYAKSIGVSANSRVIHVVSFGMSDSEVNNIMRMLAPILSRKKE